MRLSAEKQRNEKIKFLRGPVKKMNFDEHFVDGLNAPGTSVDIFAFNDTLRHAKAFVTKEDRTECITEAELVATRGTALYDAIGKVLQKCVAGSTFVVATDGIDTCSESETAESMREKLEIAQNEQRINVIFIGAGDDAYETGSRKLGLLHSSVHVESNQDVAEYLASEPFYGLVAASLSQMAEDEKEDDAKREKPEFSTSWQTQNSPEL
jgi:hypothetical protein